MRLKLAILIAALLLVQFSYAQKREFKEFIKIYAPKSSVHKISMNWLFIQFARIFIHPTKNDNDIKQWIGKLKHICIRTIDTKNNIINDTAINTLQNNLDKISYEPLIKIRDSASTISILINTNSKRRKQLIALINNGKKMVMLHVRARLSERDLSNILLPFLKNNVNK